MIWTLCGHRLGNWTGRVTGGNIPLSIALLFLSMSLLDMPVKASPLPQDPVQLVWKASPFINDCVGPKDGENRFWYDRDFNESSWTVVSLPNTTNNADGFYRAHFDLAGDIQSLLVHFWFASDDGIWIYINGNYLGHWGADCHGSCCVNNPLGGCSCSQTVPTQTIPSSWLQPENNVIACHVSNGGYGLVFTASLTSLTATQGFADVTYGYLGYAGDSYGVAWGDYDADGDEDLYISNNGANKLLRNDGGGVFTDVTTSPLGNTAIGRGVAWGDYDNDGDLDLYLANYGSANRLFRNDGAGGFVDVTSGPLGDTGSGHNAVWGDYDNDGDLDLYVANEGTANRLLRNEGNGTFVDVTSGPLGNTQNTIGAAWADYDNDWDLDLYFANWSGGTNKLLRNSSSGVFVDVTSGPLAGTGQGIGVDWGDYDNDGDLDLYVTNNNQANRLLRNNGGGIFADMTSGPLGDTGAGRGVAWADYDNDGDLDLYIVNRAPGSNKLLRNEGGGVFVDATSGTLGDTGDGHGCAWADYDNDGDLDLYLANIGGPNKLFRNDLNNGNHWIRVKLVGTLSNRAGIGARVKIVSCGKSQIREISGGSGFCSQNSLIAAFGLGACTSVDFLEVYWPSGIIQRLTGVAIDRLVQVIEQPEGLPDLVVDINRTHIAQAVVSPNLMQGKPTVVRVFLKNIGTPITSRVEIAGQLHVLDQNGSELEIIESRIVWNNNGMFSDTDKKNGKDAMNFYLDPPGNHFLAISGSDYQRKFWIRIDTGQVIHESNESNNSTEAHPITQNFRVPAEQRFAYCTVSTSRVGPNWAEVRDAYKILSQTCPLKFDPVEEYWIDNYNIRTTGSIYTDALRLDAELWLTNAARRLEKMHPVDRLVAFFPNALFGRLGGCTTSWAPSVVLVSADVRTNLGIKVAHEIGHTYGLQGEYWTDDDDDGEYVTSDGREYCLPTTDCDINKLWTWYRNGNCLGDIQYAGCANFPALCPDMGITVGRYVPKTAFKVSERRPAAWATGHWNKEYATIFWDGIYNSSDGCNGAFYGHKIGQSDLSDRTIGFMGAGNFSDEFYWITNDTYELLVKRLLGPSGTVVSGGRNSSSTLSDSSQIWIYGILTADDQVEMYSWYLRETSLPTDVLTGNGYSIDFLGSGGVNLASHPFGVVFGDEGAAPIALHLPYPAGTTRIEIRKAAVPIYGRDVSSSGPSVVLTGPNGGELSGAIDVTWTATDPDGDSTKVDLLYSPDNGTNWMALGFGIEGNSFSVDADSIPGTHGGRFRVIVSDGIHVAEDVSDNPFTIAGKPPRVTILSPADSAVVVAGASVSLKGVLVDPEDGTEPSAGLTWISSIDDTLGVGASLSLSTLQVGIHTITASGKDLDGAGAQDTIMLVVSADADGDGMPNDWEILYSCLDPDTADGYVDCDLDSLVNIDEYSYGTNPMNSDTDGDGYSDAMEVERGTDPTSPESNPSAVDPPSEKVPLSAKVLNYPNPFNPRTIIRFDVPASGRVTLRIYDVNGRLVAEPANGIYQAGEHQVEWNGRSRNGNKVASGVYFLRLDTKGAVVTSKMIILR